FSALSGDELAHIAGLQIDRLAKRLADRQLTLDVTPAALAWLAEEGNDPAPALPALRRPADDRPRLPALTSAATRSTTRATHTAMTTPTTDLTSFRSPEAKVPRSVPIPACQGDAPVPVRPKQT
ncbi:hypothetical protein, partial [Streptomyces sp. OR43]|uniref:hypothetical protein n=1 Tax=Streptomyces sp. or43 TaxID=2478957 RepID=UPI0021C575FE